MSGRGRPKGSKKKLTEADARGTQRIDAIFRRVAQEQTKQQVIRESVVYNQSVIDSTIEQLQQNSNIRHTIDTTKQTSFVVTPIESLPPISDRQLGVPLSFGGSGLSNYVTFINEKVTNTNVVALNTNKQKKRINKPEDVINLDPTIVQNTIQPTEDRPSDAQFLSSALSDGQVAVTEMATLNLEQLIAENPILADILGNPQINMAEAVASLLEDARLEEEPRTRVESSANVIVPVIEESLNVGAVERDLESQLIRSNFDFPISSQNTTNGDYITVITLPSITEPGFNSQGIEGRRETRLEFGSDLRLSQSIDLTTTNSSQIRQYQFDRYLDDLFSSQRLSQSQSEDLIRRGVFYSTPPTEMEMDVDETERVIDLDFDYVDHYLTRVTENVLEGSSITLPVQSDQAMNVAKSLPIINKYLSLPAPSPPITTTTTTTARPSRVRIRRPQGLSTLSSRRLENRRRIKNRETVNVTEATTISGNQNLEILRQRLRRLVSRVVANSVERDEPNVQVETPIELISNSQLPSQFSFE
jgi:hypothetical protein